MCVIGSPLAKGEIVRADWRDVRRGRPQGRPSASRVCACFMLLSWRVHQPNEGQRRELLRLSSVAVFEKFTSAAETGDEALERDRQPWRRSHRRGGGTHAVKREALETCQ